jgi:hypothetical protein
MDERQGGFMKEKPIIFSADMVRAILDGRKTMTRRVIKGLLPRWNAWDFVNETETTWSCVGVGGAGRYQFSCPYGIPGESRLWVRETWAHVLDFGRSTGGYFYRASYTNGGPYDDVKKWKPSIFMPRAASRITLEVTEIRVERVQDISEEDARSEGVERFNDDGVIYYGPFNKGHANPRVAFEWLWDSINAKRGYSWEANPWVWVITFKQVNVDE